MKWITLLLPLAINVARWLVKALDDGKITYEEVGALIETILGVTKEK